MRAEDAPARVGGREGGLPRATGGRLAGWVALPCSGCGQLRFLAVAETGPLCVAVT